MKKIFILTVILAVTIAANAQKPEVFTTGAGAINGYDPVAYFSMNKAVEGKKEIAFVWKGATWHFASEANKKTFEANPTAYAPQYGGYCAYGTSQGHKAATEADAYTIVDKKLYLNYNKDIRKMWTQNQTELIKKADANWPQVKKE